MEKALIEKTGGHYDEKSWSLMINEKKNLRKIGGIFNELNIIIHSISSNLHVDRFR
jgi:hypothetical protein